MLCPTRAVSAWSQTRSLTLAISLSLAFPPQQYKELKKDVTTMKTDATNKFEGGLVWAKGKIDKHPYKWMAFKVGVTTITTIICPACSIVVAAAFYGIDAISKLKDLKDAISILPEGLSDEAKAACVGAAAASTLMMITAGAVNIFVPIPL